jgi:predicted nucleic acid-binding protein
MKRLFVDANVFLRFFTGNDRSQHGSAAKLFREAATGKVSLVTGPPVLFEIAWTLRSAYDLTPEKVLDVLSRIASLPGLELADGPVVEEAISVATAGLARRRVAALDVLRWQAATEPKLPISAPMPARSHRALIAACGREAHCGIRSSTT